MANKIIPYLCKDCGETTPTQFYGRRKSKCIACCNAVTLVRYHNLDDTEKTKFKARSSAWQQDNIIQFRVISAKARARRKNMKFSITVDSINALQTKQNNRCHYTGVEMSETLNDLHCISIDRIDSNLGYVDSNVVLTSQAINKMKSDYSTEQFIMLCELVVKSNDTILQ